MDLIVDHVVILVEELARAVEDYSALGFTVVPGGEHADGLTHNALIALSDGAYIELIAFKGEPPEGHPFGRAVPWGGGLVAYALLPRDIEKTIEEARERGLRIQGPTPGGRVRPDGLEIAWQTGRAAVPEGTLTFDLPFLCADVTPRERRVPTGDARNHANGVMGIESITVLVRDLDASVKRYRALLGIKPRLLPGEEGFLASPIHFAEFRLGETIIVLMELVDGQTREQLMEREGSLWDSDGPCTLTLRAQAGATTGPLDPRLTHGARIEVVGESK